MSRERGRHVAPSPGWLHSAAQRGTVLVLAVTLCAGHVGFLSSQSGIAMGATASAIQGELVVLTDCTVQPRRQNDLVALARAPQGVARDLAGETDTAVATPEPPPVGVPADPEIADSVTVTVREMVACYNAGDLRRLFALYSEEYLFRVWGGFAGENPSRAEMRQAIDFISMPVPQPESAQVAFISVEDVRQLPGGDVSAIVNLSTGSSRSVFAYTDGWYQLVWSYPTSEADSTAP